MTDPTAQEGASTAPDTISFKYRSKAITLSGEWPDEYVFGMIRATGAFYELDLLEALSHLDLTDGIVVDVGAHIGNHTIYFASVMGLRTVAIEPRPESFHLLQMNVAANGVTELVEAHQVALGASAGRASLVQRDPNNTGAFRTEVSQTGDVRVVPLDELISTGARVSLLKIDVEGAERSVLDGAASILTTFRPVVVAESHDGSAFRSMFRRLEPLGYQPVGVFGRSENWVFASSEVPSPVDPMVARHALSLLAERSALRVRNGRLDVISERLGSLGLQAGRDMGRIGAKLEGLARVQEEMTSLLSTRIANVERELGEMMAVRERQLALWQGQYRRLSRSRLLRWMLRIRGIGARLGLVRDYPVYTPEEIDRLLLSEGDEGSQHP